MTNRALRLPRPFPNDRQVNRQTGSPVKLFEAADGDHNVDTSPAEKAAQQRFGITEISEVVPRIPCDAATGWANFNRQQSRVAWKRERA
jgi:hypothetical protein